MAKAPAFQLYAADFLVDTLDWPPLDVGIFVRLLMYEWVNGWIKNDIGSIARIGITNRKVAGQVWKRISHKFEVGPDGNLRNDRLEREREKQLRFRELCVIAGKKSVEVRSTYLPPSVEPTLKPTPQPESNSSVFSLQSSTSKSKTTAKAQTPFVLPEWVSEDDWQAYEEMRRRIRKPMTDRARSLMLHKLGDLRIRGHDPKEVLEQSVMNSWQGLFEVRSNGNGSGDRRRSVGEEAADRVFGRDEKPLPQ